MPTSSDTPRRHVVILAAGKGTRMMSDRAKVLHEAAGKPLVSWVLEAAETIDPDSVTVVVGHQADEVRAILPSRVRTVLQIPQNGTGHAALLAVEALALAAGDLVLVLPGDMPLVSPATLDALVSTHEAGVAAVVVSAIVGDPHGYGRVVRTASGDVRAIVEELDATEAERAIREVNTSIYSFRADRLRAALAEVGTDNAQGEQYLTDVVGWLTARGDRVEALVAPAEEGMGVNTTDQLGAVSRRLEERIRPGSHEGSRPLR